MNSYFSNLQLNLCARTHNRYTDQPIAALISSHFTSLVGSLPSLNPEIVPNSSTVPIQKTSLSILVCLSRLYYQSRVAIRLSAYAKDSQKPTRFFSQLFTSRQNYEDSYSKEAFVPASLCNSYSFYFSSSLSLLSCLSNSCSSASRRRSSASS